MIEINSGAQHWVDHRHPEWMDNHEKWEYVMDHYTGAVLDDDKIRKYLVRRSNGEALEAYNERINVAKYNPHIASIIESLAGVLFTVDIKTERDFGPLGDHDDRSSQAGMLWADANSDGDAWLKVYRKLAIHVMLTRKQWVLVQPRTIEDPAPDVRIISPLSVVNWYESGGRMSQVLVMYLVDTRTSVADPPSHRYEYQLYGIDGWARYAKVKNGNSETVVEIDSGSYSYVDRNGKPVLPIFRVDLPLTRDVGYIAAKSYNATWNAVSLRDFVIRSANSPFMVSGGNDEEFNSIGDSIEEGARLLQEGENANTRFIAPSSEPANVATTTINDDIVELYTAMSRDYGDSAVEKTATEVRQNVGTGIGAFLNLLKTTIDEAETKAIHLISQQQGYTGDAAFEGFVQRTDDFKPFDVDAEIDRLTTRYWGPTGTVPVGVEGEVEVAARINEWNGLPVDRDAIREEVERRRTQSGA